MIDILIPTYGRAGKLAGVADNIFDNTCVPCSVTFIIEADDEASDEACRLLPVRVVVNSRSRNYSGAINTGYRQSPADCVFAGADDLEFHPGWDEKALSRMWGDIQVVGTNDLYNPSVLNGTHATHYLVNTSYLDVVGGVADEGRHSFLYEGYTHNYCDTEFISTARHRGVFVPCLDSVVKHLHWSIGLSEKDATSEKGQASFWQDDAKYNARSHLWT